MARVVMVTGGTRSGKSEFAMRLAESLPGPRAFVATCPVSDDEMAERIRRHKARRAAGNWRTFEEATDLAGLLASLGEYRVILVECLTLWVNNLLFHEAEGEAALTEDRIRTLMDRALMVSASLDASVVFVTNEVGMGIVPENPLARRWRDLVGACNQTAAAAADEAFMVVCGLPIRLKAPLDKAPLP